jgi:PKD repeat protein
MVFNQRNDITFICDALGGPNNIFQWKMDGKIIRNDSMLEVKDIDASSGGVYTCTVSNAAGNDSASTILYVAPYIVTPLEEQTLTTNGSNINISCDADGFPSPTVSWVDMTNAEVVNASLLEFSPVMFGDEGLYRCVATTEINMMNFTTTDDTILIG